MVSETRIQLKYTLPLWKSRNTCSSTWYGATFVSQHVFMTIPDSMHPMTSSLLILTRATCAINCGGGDFFFGNYDIKYRKIETRARNWSEHDFERSFHILLCSVAFLRPCMDYLVLGDLNIMTCWTSTDMNVLGKTLNYHKIFRPYLTSKWTQTTPQCTCQGGKDSFGFVFFFVRNGYSIHVCHNV